MKSKVICKGVQTIPESKEPGARVYHNATFKRVADEVDPSVRLEFATWGPEPSPFVPGKKYIVEVTECETES